MINIKDQEFLDQLAERLRTIRKEKGMSQEDLAYKSNLALSQIGRIERGETNPTICTLKVLADGLEVTLSELFNLDRPSKY
ncbi:MAG: helix-turn-helix transcriptional regulator [Saprospiraceae bacterium]|nr:helix-turn-helix transcriptional regulator [Saprospiraceae bacterium]